MIQDYYNEIRLVAELIVLFILGLYATKLKAYYKKRGEILATKDDLKDVTREVEAVKTEFIRETEKLKIDLQFSNQLKFSIKSEEKGSLLQSYENFYIWFTYLNEYDLGKYDYETREMIWSDKDKMDDLYHAFLISQAKMELYVKSQFLTFQLNMLKSETRSFMHDVSLESIGYVGVLNKIQKKDMSHEEQNQAKLEILRNLNKIQGEYSRKITPLINDFKDRAYNHLIELI